MFLQTKSGSQAEGLVAFPRQLSGRQLWGAGREGCFCPRLTPSAEVGVVCVSQLRHTKGLVEKRGDPLGTVT